MKTTVDEDQARRSARSGGWNFGRGDGTDLRRGFGRNFQRPVAGPFIQTVCVVPRLSSSLRNAKHKTMYHDTPT